MHIHRQYNCKADRHSKQALSMEEGKLWVDKVGVNAHPP